MRDNRESKVVGSNYYVIRDSSSGCGRVGVVVKRPSQISTKELFLRVRRALRATGLWGKVEIGEVGFWRQVPKRMFGISKPGTFEIWEVDIVDKSDSNSKLFNGS